MLSQTSEHALRAVLHLARESSVAPIAAGKVASALNAPSNYLSKTLNALAKEGILESTTGRKGGFTLAVPPRELTVARVVEVFQGRAGKALCLLDGSPCERVQSCPLHDSWMSIVDAGREALEGTTIADLLGDPDARSGAGGRRH